MLEKMRNEVKMARREHDFAWQKVCNAQSLLDMIISSTHNDYEFEAALAEVVNSHEYKDARKEYETIGDEYFEMLAAL